jgi:sugar phosphate isomerase/epimerase
MSAHELCIANLSLADAGPIDLIDAAAAAGFDSVNVWLTPPPGLALFAVRRPDVPAVIGDPAQVGAIRRRLAATGVSIYAASSGWLGAQFDLALIRPLLSTVAELGGRSVAVVGWDPERARLVDHLGRCCSEARAFELQIGLEFMPYSAVPTLDDAAGILAELRAPNARLIVDALHLARSGGMPADLARVAPEAIGSLQLCDAPVAAPPRERLREESVNGRLYPGEGELPLAALLAALPPGVPVEVETPVLRDAQLALLERARRCGDAARRFLARLG